MSLPAACPSPSEPTAAETEPATRSLPYLPPLWYYPFVCYVPFSLLSIPPSFSLSYALSLFDLSLKVGFIQMKPVADTRHLQTQALSLPLTHPQARFPPPRWGQKQTSHSGCCNIKKICVFLYIINVFFPLFLHLISFFLSIWAEIPSCIASIEQNRIFLFRSWFSSF